MLQCIPISVSQVLTRHRDGIAMGNRDRLGSYSSRGKHPSLTCSRLSPLRSSDPGPTYRRSSIIASCLNAMQRTLTGLPLFPPSCHLPKTHHTAHFHTSQTPNPGPNTRSPPAERQDFPIRTFHHTRTQPAFSHAYCSQEQNERGCPTAAAPPSQLVWSGPAGPRSSAFRYTTTATARPSRPSRLPLASNTVGEEHRFSTERAVRSLITLTFPHPPLQCTHTPFTYSWGGGRPSNPIGECSIPWLGDLGNCCHTARHTERHQCCRHEGKKGQGQEQGRAVGPEPRPSPGLWNGRTN